MGTIQTLQAMKRLTIQAIHSQEPRQIVSELITSGFCADPLDLTRALRFWILRHVAIVDEFEELLKSPRLMIQEIQSTGRTMGDCDDIAMLGAAVMGSAGLPVRFKAVFPTPDGSFAHVFTEHQLNGAWYAFDPTVSHVPVYPSDFLIEDITS